MENLPKTRLRAIEPEDLEDLYLIENDQELWRVGITNVPYSRFALHEYLASVTGDIFTDKQLRLIIENMEGETIGLVDLCNFDPRHMRAEVGIVLQTRFHDKGYGRSAMLQLIRYSHEVVHLHQMYALVSLHNVRSMELFRTIGFQQVAEISDWLYDGEHYESVILMQYFL